jgi:hypothetical protein
VVIQDQGFVFDDRHHRMVAERVRRLRQETRNSEIETAVLTSRRASLVETNRDLHRHVDADVDPAGI